MSRHVTVVTSVHQPDDPRIRYKTVETLRSHGWRVTYVCPQPGPTDTNGVDVTTLGGGRITRLVRAARIMWTSKSDVVVIHDPELLIPALPLAVAKRSTRFVLDLHENLPLQLRTRAATPAWLRTATSSMSRLVLRWAERAMAVTLAEPGYATLFRSDPPAFENYPMTDRLPRRTLDAHGVVYVGDITEARGASLLVEAVGRLDGVRLTMIGRCSQPLAQRLVEAADRASIPFELTGFLPYDEAWSLASRSLIGVSPILDAPNYRNSLPTKLIEYRAVGLTVVASDLPGSVPFAEGAGCTLVPPGDAGLLASAIASLVEDTDAQEAALADIETVRNAYAWDGHRFAEYYDSLVTFDR